MKRIIISFIVCLLIATTVFNCSFFVMTEEEYYWYYINKDLPTDNIIDSCVDNEKNVYILGSNGKVYLINEIKGSKELDVRISNVQKIDILEGVLYYVVDQSVYAYDLDLCNITLIYTAQGSINNIYCAGNIIIVNDDSGAWNTNTLIKVENYEVTDQRDWQEKSTSYVFSSKYHSVFTLRDGIIPDDICYIDIDLIAGKITDYGDSPYHGDYYYSHPLRMSFDEEKIYINNGDIYKTSDLTYIGNIGFNYTDLVDIGDRIVIVDGLGKIKVFNEDYQLLKEINIGELLVGKIYCSDGDVFLIGSKYLKNEIRVISKETLHE